MMEYVHILHKFHLVKDKNGTVKSVAFFCFPKPRGLRFSTVPFGVSFGFSTVSSLFLCFSTVSEK